MLPWFKKGVVKGVKENLEPAIHLAIYLFLKHIVKETPHITAEELLESVKNNLDKKIIIKAEELDTK